MRNKRTSFNFVFVSTSDSVVESKISFVKFQFFSFSFSRSELQKEKTPLVICNFRKSLHFFFFRLFCRGNVIFFGLVCLIYRVLSGSTIHRAMESLCRSISGASSCWRESFLLPSGSHGTSNNTPKFHIFFTCSFLSPIFLSFWISGFCSLWRLLIRESTQTKYQFLIFLPRSFVEFLVSC